MQPGAADRSQGFAVPPSQLNLKHVKHGFQYFVNHFLSILLIPLMAAITIKVISLGPDQMVALFLSLQLDPVHILSLAFLVILPSALYFSSRPRTVHLVDYALYKPPTSCRIPFAAFMEHAKLVIPDHPESVEFMVKMLERSGLGEETYIPTSSHYIPPRPTMEAAREESRQVIFSAVGSLLEKTGIRPKDIDILVVNCSVFSPTPSLSAMVVNKFKLRSNIRSFNLSGMGCSAGLLSIDLARDLLQAHPNSYALVVSTEIITPSNYHGNQRSMLLPNCIFRMGGAAVLLSNKSRDRQRAKYRLLHVVRTHMGADDKAYRCVYEEEDPEGLVGVSLSKDLPSVAANALKTNIEAIGPLVLPVSEKLLFLLSTIAQKLFDPERKLYVPDFKAAFEHFCIHAGGRAVIDKMERNLDLSPEHVEASRMTLHRFGNTSSSSLWYELSYIEGKGRMKKGDRVWQIALGSGFKCNSAVWKCNRTIKEPVEAAWADRIDKYPIDVPRVVKL